MSIAALIRSMATAGASPEAIALAVEAVEAAEGKFEAVRAAARDRKRRQREKDVTVTGQSRDTDGTVTAETPSLPLPPQTPPTPTHPRGDIYTPARGADRFEAFWAAYPRKVAKDAARKAFAKAVHRMTEDDPLAVILAGIERALPGWTDPNFIPHPASWLNAGRWEDEAPNVTPLRLTHGKPDKLTARHDNYDASWAGSESAAGLLAARRAL